MAIIVNEVANGMYIFIENSSRANVQELISRALNTWDQAPAELKIMGDKVCNNGVVLQDYEAQEHAKPRSE